MVAQVSGALQPFARALVTTTLQGLALVVNIPAVTSGWSPPQACQIDAKGCANPPG
jgi:hypothetical protein